MSYPILYGGKYKTVHPSVTPIFLTFSEIMWKHHEGNAMRSFKVCFMRKRFFSPILKVELIRHSCCCSWPPYLEVWPYSWWAFLGLLTDGRRIKRLFSLKPAIHILHMAHPLGSANISIFSLYANINFLLLQNF